MAFISLPVASLTLPQMRGNQKESGKLEAKKAQKFMTLEACE